LQWIASYNTLAWPGIAPDLVTFTLL